MRALRLRWPSLLVLAALAASGCSGSSAAQGTQTSSSTTSSTTATVPAASATTPSPSPTAPKDLATSAKAAYVHYIQAVDSAYGNPEKATREQLSKVATAAALTFLLSELQELRKEKVHQKGSVTIKKMTVKSVSPAAGKRLAQVSLTACVDHGNSTYVDSQGKPLFSQPKGPQLAQGSVLMVLDAGNWLVANENNVEVKSC